MDTLIPINISKKVGLWVILTRAKDVIRNKIPKYWNTP